MHLSPKACPCGCNKVILEPVFGCQCSSLREEEAREVYEALTNYAEVKRALASLLGLGDQQSRKDAEEVLLKAERCSMPVEPVPEWQRRR